MTFWRNDLKFLSFLTKLTYKNYDSNMFLLYMYALYNRITKFENTFALKSTPDKVIKQYLGNITMKDLHNTIIIDNSKNHFYIKYVLIKIEHDGVLLTRKAHVITAELEDKDAILISNTLAHNLKNVTNCKLERLLTPWRCAQEVCISLISSPHDWDNFVTDLILKNYFSTPKIVQKNDILQIDLEEYGKKIIYSKNVITDRNEKVYFKVMKVILNNRETENGYLCVDKETSLRTFVNVQSFLPKIPDTVPYGLINYFDKLVRACRPFLRKDLKLDLLPVFLLQGNKGSGKRILMNSLASHFGMHLHTVYSFEISANIYAQNEVKLKNTLFTSKMSAPCILEIRNFENFGKNADGEYDERIIDQFIVHLDDFFKKTDFPIIIFCCTNESDIPLDLKRVFLKIFEINALNSQERLDNLKWILEQGQEYEKIDLDDIASKTHGFLFEDLRTLVYHALTNYNKDVKKEKYEVSLSLKHFTEALNFMQINHNQSIGAAKVPKVQWSDIGGLNDVKEEIIKLIKWPLEHPKLLKSIGLKRSGILLYGPPGTGKTLTAKAVATECGLCFLSVKGPELLNMYVGQSEQNVREVFERAREASPCIIFFDELDSLAPNRGASGDSGGVMDRVVSQLLAEMDGIDQSHNVFIIGATNRPDLIDPALLRPGRFDKLLYVGPCTDRTSKLAVLEALTRKFKLKDFDLGKIVDLCPESLSGADFYGLCSAAWMSAARRLIYEQENSITPRNISQEDVEIILDDFKSALKNVRPSITKKDLEYFKQLKNELS